MEIHVGDNRKPLKKTEVLFVVAALNCYKNRATDDNTDLSNIDLGDSYYFPIVAKFCYLGYRFTEMKKMMLILRQR